MCNIWPEFTSYSDRNEYTQIRYLTIKKMEIIQEKLPKLGHTSQKNFASITKTNRLVLLREIIHFFRLQATQKWKIFQFETSGDINS